MNNDIHVNEQANIDNEKNVIMKEGNKELEIKNQQNIVEDIKNELETIKYKYNYYSENYNKDFKDKFMEIMLLIFLGGFVSALFIAPAAEMLLDQGLKSYLIPYLQVWAVFDIAAISFSNISEKNLKKVVKGYEVTLKHLEDELLKEEEKLEELKNSKSLKSESKNKSSIEYLKSLKKQIKIYYDLGYNNNKYKRQYKKGVLEHELSKNYDQEEIDIAKKYMEDEGPVLVKRKNRN